jgi:HD-GYP domain-containing protein (c-di-GMP phosphodiesterase class II)/HAMP domain-containing protein
MSGEASALESRFGLRIVLVFMASAIVPILVLALLAYMSTRAQLERDATAALEREAKLAAMSILERIRLGAARLDLEARGGGRERDAGVGTERIFSRVERRPLEALPLSREQLAHLRRNGFVLSSGGSVSDGLRLARLDANDRALLGTFTPEFLYTPERIGDDERYWVTDHTGGLLFPDSAETFGPGLLARVEEAEDRVGFHLETSDGGALAMVWPLYLKQSFLSPPIRVGIARSERAILRPLDDFRFNFLATLLLATLGSAAIALHQIRLRVGPLRELIDVTGRIERGDFSARTAISSGDEFEGLGESINSMAEELRSNFATLETLRHVAETLLDVTDRRSVCEVAVPAGRLFSGAREGRLFAIDHTHDPGDPWLFAIEGGGERFTSRDDGQASEAFARRSLVAHEIVWLRRDAGEDAGTWSALDALTGMRVEAVCEVPLVSGQGRPEGVLELLYFELPSRDTVEAGLGSLEILSAQAGAALRKLAMIQELRGLFEGVVRLTVDAIDEKSPYTGDHCRRVPILTEMLADAVCEDDEGPFKDFTLSPNERYELKIAALLHDCGKVATPVHVMDKGTKLETIIDRIELVRTRAEIIRRDLEAAALRRLLVEQGVDPSDVAPDAEALAALEADLAFVSEANVGGESIEHERLNRIDAIHARYAWTDAAGEERGLITDDEAMNLRIGRGTLNEHEREIINNHVVTTIRLLDQLPFPPEMKNVPSIAGAHHEHVDGTGYPKGLAHDELSVQCRLLGLADVFEALTAKTRPYKPGKPLTETLAILRAMVDRGELDADLHEVFLRKRVYMRYAIEHVDPAQIDGPHREEFERMTAAWEAEHGA